MLVVIGDLLDGSGWTYVMTSANITTVGRTSGLQKGSHTSRGAHHVTQAALFILLRRSYVEYRSHTPDDEQLHFDEFDYWYKVLQLELLFLQFLRSQRQHDFVPYVDSHGKIIPWMFALDLHYARWMTVHVQDLLALKNTRPTTHETFHVCNFVTQKSSHKYFSYFH